MTYNIMTKLGVSYTLLGESSLTLRSQSLIYYFLIVYLSCVIFILMETHTDKLRSGLLLAPL